MPSWWSKLKALFGGSPERPTERPAAEPAQWLDADAPGNPFDVPILDLMVTQTLVATSTDPQVAARSVSWSGRTGEDLEPGPLLERPAIDCNLTYAAARSLPEGLLHTPSSMDEKWVLAWRGGRVLVVHSWSGEIEAVADATHVDETLTIHELRLAESTPLSSGDPVAVLDWMIRSHALQQKLPFPADDATAALFEAVPFTAFTFFGNVIFCAARSWNPPPVERPLRSDGLLVRAVQSGDLDAVNSALGEDVDSPSTFEGYTPLHIAIVKGSLPLIARLLEAGADVRRRADGGMFALGIAIVHGHDDAVLDALAAAGAELDATNDDGFGALHAACEVGRVDAIEWLLARGADIEARTNRGFAPLHIAGALGHLDAAKALVSRGADRGAVSTDNKDVMALAREEGQAEVVAWLEAM